MIHGNSEVEHETEASQEISVGAPAAQEQTLHDFVLNLLGDTAARAAFAQDPAQALQQAGLEDITAQDVQDVIPLVMDYGNVAQGALPTDAALGAVPTDAALGAVPTDASLGALPTDAALGALPTDAGLGALPTEAAGLEGAIQQLQGVAGVAGQRLDLGGDDLTEGLTAGVTSGVTEAAAGGIADLDGVSGAARFASDVAMGEGAADISPEGANLGAHADTLVGNVAGIGGAGTDSSGGGLTADTVAGSASGLVDGGLDGVTGDLRLDSEQVAGGQGAAFLDADTDGAAGGAGLDTDILSAEGSAAASADSLAAGGSVTSPFGTYGVELAGDPAVPAVPDLETTGDLADTLDTDTLTRSSEAAASTVATYVTSDGAALTGVAPVDDLPVDVPAAGVAGVAGVAGDLPLDRAALSGVSETVPAGAGDLPIDAVQAPVDVPTDVAGAAPVDEARNLLEDTTSNLTENLPADLSDVPADLPELPVANPLPESGGVTEAVPSTVSEGAARVTETVSDSPLGSVADTGEDLLPDTGVSDLDLGH